MAVFDPLEHFTAPDDLQALRELASQARKTWYDQPSDQGCPHPLCEMVEIGTWAGSTALILQALADRVYCIDTWEGNPGDRLGPLATKFGHARLYTTFCQNMGELLYRRVFPVHCDSLLAAASWPRKVALVFIDGNHEYGAVKSDILAWRNLIVPGGIICGHDYKFFPGVTQAVEELIPEFQLFVKGCSVWATTVR